MTTLIQSLQNLLSTMDSQTLIETRRILLKESLQVLVLDFLYNHTYYRELKFYGGSCLRMVYGLNRLSEDLDLDNSGRYSVDGGANKGLDLSHLKDDLLAYFHQVLKYPNALVKIHQSAAGILRITIKLPVLQELKLSSNREEALHLKLEISHHYQVSQTRRTPIITFGRSFVPIHFTLETMMAAKMLACLERSFEKGSTTVRVKGRDYYDLLWFIQKRVQPLEEKLYKDGSKPYSTKMAMEELSKRVGNIHPHDLRLDLLPLFEKRTFIEAWLESFQENFQEWVRYYL